MEIICRQGDVERIGKEFKSCGTELEKYGLFTINQSSPCDGCAFYPPQTPVTISGATGIGDDWEWVKYGRYKSPLKNVVTCCNPESKNDE